MSPNVRGKTIELKDGRNLGYAEYGDLNGIAVFHFHGSAGSRVEHPSESILKNLKIRYISVDRPGHGLSDFVANRKLLDWPGDIEQLADYLRINKFYVLGWSSGGPYALACTYKLKGRVIAGVIVSGTAPPNRPKFYHGYPIFAKIYMFSARHMKAFVSLLRRMSYSSVKKSDGKIKIDCFPQADKNVLENDLNYQMFVKDIIEGYRQGWRGVAQDDIIIFNDWGFNIEDINTRIDIWQGELDTNVLAAHGKYQNNKIPQSRLFILNKQGHLYIFTHWEKILSHLIGGQSTNSSRTCEVTDSH